MADTIRERGRPSEEIDMAKYIGSGRGSRPADENFCCWPTCSAMTMTYPLCRRHQIRVYVKVREEVEFISQGLRNVEPAKDTRTGWVYFVRYRDRVKIGYSIDPRERIKAHPVDEVLAVVPGERVDEKRMHAVFAHLRENGEWFRAEPELLEYARGLADEEYLARLA